MEVGNLQDGYLAKFDKYPDNEEKILVMRGRGNDELAPSKGLLDDYKKLEKKCGNRWEAWKRSHYESRFKEKVREKESRKRIKEIAQKVASGKNVRLICYEKGPPCHRFILKELIGAEITRILVAPLRGERK